MTTDRTQEAHRGVVWFKNLYGIDVMATVKDDCIVYHNVMKQLNPAWPDIIDPVEEAKRNELIGSKKGKKKS